MALSAATLKTQLLTMELYSDEASARNAFAAAFNNYFLNATSNGTPIVPAACTTAKSALSAALVGMSTPNQGATILQTAITAYWTAIVAAAAVAWPTVTVITPPAGLSGIAASLSSVFAANTSGNKSKDEAMGAVANAIHATQLGGLALWPVPIGSQPIL